MSFISKLIVTIIALFIGVFLMAVGNAISPIFKPIVGLTLTGAIIAIWRSQPPKKDDYQLRKN